MSAYPRRYTSVPWLSDDGDLQPQGDPSSVVELHGGDELVIGLHVREPFGKGSDAMIAVHATKGDGNDGGEVTLAITDDVRLEVKPVIGNLHSNPRRQADGDPGDD